MPQEAELNLSDGEKLIIAMLCDFIKHSGAKGEIDPDFVQDAIYSGESWALEWKYPGIFEAQESSSESVKNVNRILLMWDLIERACEGLTEAERGEISEAAFPYDSNSRFMGFDGNNEGEFMGIARMLIHGLERWQRFDDRDLNSHMPTLDNYLRGSRALDGMMGELTDGDLNKDQLIAIFQSMKHPDA